MKKILTFIIAIHLLLCGCGFLDYTHSLSSSTTGKAAHLGYTIQAGAFSNVDNAARFTALLEGLKLEPFYFRDKDSLYKVRFGNFGSREIALSTARELKKRRLLDDFYVVSPSEYTKPSSATPKGIRNELVQSARGYLGVPYKWGGESRAGIDCSGLTQAVYNLNGLSIPRNSAEQHRRGTTVAKGNLQPGDLVFFATSGGSKVSHVGIYTGNGIFIHAPGQGKKVTEAHLADSYFAKTYVGARSYL